MTFDSYAFLIKLIEVKGKGERDSLGSNKKLAISMQMSEYSLGYWGTERQKGRT